ncbi:MAG: ATP synthase subunit I [Gammaproteobacteria bacterium]
MENPTMGGAADPRVQQRGLTGKNSRAQALPGHKKIAYRIVAAQTLVTVVLALLLLGISGGRSAYSALVGGLVSVFSNFYLAAKLFRFERGAAPASIVRAFYIGEGIKILITAASFVVIFAVLHTEALYVLLTYGATLLVYWFALIATPSK